MIDLTKRLCDLAAFSNNWKSLIAWLETNVGSSKFEKLNVLQGHGWMIIRTIQDGDHYYNFKLYFDDPKLEVMFVLAWS
jgi:hypothetical protein